MKKSIFLCLVICLFAPITIDAQKKPFGNGLYWELNDGVLKISGNGAIPEHGSPNWYNIKEYVSKIVINYGVTDIGDGCFSGFSKIKSVSIPSSVKAIGTSVFLSCEDMTSITIPNSVTNIGNYVFANCINLKSITMPNTLSSISKGTFSGCENLTSITIPSSVTCIGESAFVGCKSLTNIVIPSSVKVIENGAFSGCRALTSINLPNSIVNIGDFAFSGCTNLQSISLPNSISSIGQFAISQCESLKTISIPNSLKNIEDKAFFTDSYENLEIVSIPQWLIDKGKDEWTRCGLSETAVNRYMKVSAIRVKGGYASAVELINGSTKYYKVSKNGCYGLTDAEGKVIVPTELEALATAGEGFLKYKLNGFWGVMNYSGKIIIDTDRGYTSIGDFVTFTKRFPYTMLGYKGECDVTGKQISKIKVDTPQQTTTASSSSKTSSSSSKNNVVYEYDYSYDASSNIHTCLMKKIEVPIGVNSSIEDIGKTFKMEIFGNKNKAIIIGLFLTDTNEGNAIAAWGNKAMASNNEIKGCSISLSLSNGEIIRVNENKIKDNRQANIKGSTTMGAIILNLGYASSTSTGKSFANRLEGYNYVLEQCCKYNIRAITFNGQTFEMNNAQTASTINSMITTIRSK